jgi:predicted nucleic acid-binding protein
VGTLTLDANVAIALFDGTDAHHTRAVDEITAAINRETSFLMPASAYSEIMVHAIRQQRGELVERFVARLGMEIVPVDREIAARAAELRAEHRTLRLPDALVLATAHVRDVALLTFDGRLAQL